MKNQELKDAFNKLAFMTPTIVELCDILEGSTVPQHQLKFHLKRLNLEAQKLLAKHYTIYENYGTITSHDGEKEMPTEDIYNITAKAYDFLLNKNPHVVCCIAEIIKRGEEKGLDYSKINVQYKPILNES